jgi:hypothetical protein
VWLPGWKAISWPYWPGTFIQAESWSGQPVGLARGPKSASVADAESQAATRHHPETASQLPNATVPITGGKHRANSSRPGLRRSATRALPP